METIPRMIAHIISFIVLVKKKKNTKNQNKTFDWKVSIYRIKQG